MIKQLSIFLVLAYCSAGSAQELSGIKCIVMGERNVNEKYSAKHLDGEVYFCCARCKTAFEKDSEKFSTKANHQLVLTGQYVQTACPSGEESTDTQHKHKIAGVEVSFCSESHMKKVGIAPDMEAKVKLVFADKPFRTAFSRKENEIDISKAKCISMPEHQVSREFWVDYLDGKIFFCCEDCRNEFDKKKLDKEFMIRANEQLFATGQYKQRLCPMGGGELNDENFVEFNGNQVRLCCTDCRDHLKSLDSDDKKAKTIYNDKTFKKSFVKSDE